MEDAWPEFERLARESRNDVRVQPARSEDGRRALETLRVTTQSAVGALALHTEITLIGDGWLRLRGAGGRITRCRLTSLGEGELPLAVDHGLVIAYDVVGGFFAVDGGGLGGPRGEVRYLAPDTLEWEGTTLGHGDW